MMWRVRNIVRFAVYCLCLFIGANAWAQNFPRIGYVYPAGGRQGTTFQVSVGGQFLDSVTNAYISGKGVTASVIEHTKPLSQREFTVLRDKLRELQEKRIAAAKRIGNNKRRAGASSNTNMWTTADEKMVAEIRKKLANPPNRNANPAIVETVTLRVTMASDAEPGRRDLRLEMLTGLSNPLAFHVGQLAEFSKAAAKAPLARRASTAQAAAPEEMTVRIPCVANGQIMPGGVDRFRFSARQGQKLVLAVSARELIPYLPDAVPGWFQATLAVYDSKGKEVAYDDDFRFHPDPVVYYEVPRDGEYVAEIRDSIYRGREDFVYRLSIGELPFVTGVFPLGAAAGTQTKVELKGWNLAEDQIMFDARDKAPGVYPINVRKQELIAEPIWLAVDNLPECMEADANDETSSAQVLALPMIVNGRISAPGDRDVFRFQGKAGDQVVAEVQARRLDSPLDSVLKLTDSSGRQLALNDDFEDKGAGLMTHHADSRLSVKLPATGTYFVHLVDAQGKGGAEYGYRLRISAPRPDFELRVTPSTVSGRVGASVPITVYALRKDGFTNEIKLTLAEAPQGCALSGAWVPPGQDQVRLTLSMPLAVPAKPFSVKVQGTATINGREVVRAAVPAEDLMQAFAYRHLVPVQDMIGAVVGRGSARTAIALMGKKPVQIPAGGTVAVRIAAPRGPLAGQTNLELSEPPEGNQAAEFLAFAGWDRTRAGERRGEGEAGVAREPAGERVCGPSPGRGETQGAGESAGAGDVAGDSVRDCRAIGGIFSPKNQELHITIQSQVSAGQTFVRRCRCEGERLRKGVGRLKEVLGNPTIPCERACGAAVREGV